MGREFWEKQLNALISAGEDVGESEHAVKKEICYAMVSIYDNLNLWSEAYNYLVIQAREYDWIHDFTVQKIVKNSSLHSTLKDVI